MQKQCFKCGETKPLKDFYRHKETADGHLNKCKVCTKNDVNKNRYKNHEYYLEYDRKRFHENEDRREAQRLTSLKMSRKHHNKTLARSKLRCAVLSGRLVKQPCAVCGTTENIEAHHEDYSKPLDVVWLCRKHHGEVHRTVVIN